MTPDLARELALTLVPADGPADAQVFDDLIRLIRQGLATASDKQPRVAEVGPTRSPQPGEVTDIREAETQIKHRIAQDGAASQQMVERRAAAARPDAADKLADEARLAAEAVIVAVQRTLLHGVQVRRPDDPPPSA